jgi:hypothetical protein
MRKVYNYKNATIIILNANVCTTEKFKKSTENFIKKVIKERDNNGDTNQTGNFSK